MAADCNVQAIARDEREAMGRAAPLHAKVQPQGARAETFADRPA